MDERTEYLRRTYTSLRAGRRNLHTRICQYLRSPRTAKFSQDSMLKQEEALAELDASIDDWVTKLEQAENRRTRVRQKLLEHVAAAVTLPASSAAVVDTSENLQLAMGIRPISTPPRSPTKPAFAHTLSSSPSPQRVVAQVPSTILEQPLGEDGPVEVVLSPADKEAAAAQSSLRRAETIRIYADNDVYALLADVEHQITQMSSGVDLAMAKDSPAASDDEKSRRNRAQTPDLPKPSVPIESKVAATTPLNIPSNNEELFLTSAVFRPNHSALLA